MPAITWLHLSDLHFRAEAQNTWDRDIVLRTLVEDVRGMIASQGLRPDFILVSGDIAFSGLFEEYEQARRFFDQLLQTTGLSKERLLVVPGNHDVDRKSISRGAKAIAASLDTRQAINEVLAHNGDRRLILSRFDAYARFVNDYFPGLPAFSDEQYYGTRTFNLAGQRVAVLGLNSAWLSAGNEDRGRLALGEPQVRQALEASREASLRIALMHHPFDWLREFDRNDCEALLMEGCGFILHGHLHRPGILNLRTPDSGAMILAAGAAYDTREYPNGYNWVRLDDATGEGKVFLRAYSDKQGGFWTQDTMTYKNVDQGEFTFPLSTKAKAPSKRKTRLEPLAASTKLEANYLRRVQTISNALPLAVIDPKAVERTRQQSLDLLPLYVSLLTRTQIKVEGEATKKGKRRRLQDMADPERETRILSALEVAARERQMVLLGDPGSGKSTFINYLSLCLAGARLKQLGEPALLSGDHWLSHLEPAWTHGPMLPLQITLRRFSKSPYCDGTAEGLWNFIEETLAEQALADFIPHLRRMLAEGGVLVLLDGLDEVADPKQRQVVRDAVAALAGTYQHPNNRYLVTCRGYAYQDACCQLDGFPSHELAPFNQEQIDAFIGCWYNEIKKQGWKSPQEAENLIQQLQSATHRPDLAPLAASPLQLAMMASLHFSWGQLPQDRVQLYQEMVRLLLVRWQEARLGKDAGLFLKLTSNELESALERVAFNAHRTQTSVGGTADISEPDVRGVLKDFLNGDWNQAGDMLAYIQDRAGLLIDRGNRTFTFPHRSYQEYLAGSFLAVQPDFPDTAARLARENYAQWREGILWSVGVMARLKKMVHVAVDVVAVLCPPEASITHVSETDGRLAHLAGEALLEIGLKEVESRARYASVLNRVRNGLVTLIEQEVFTPKERAMVGITLGKLDDSRPGVRLKDGLLDITDFIPLPGGKFKLGNTGPLVEVSPFHLSRYPVTVAQYQVFVDQGGYGIPNGPKPSWWTDEGWKWKKEEQIAGPRDYGPVFLTPNHPRVGVSWFEAMAFCSWLTERLRANRELAKSAAIALPTEAQWEWAARWNKELLAPDDRLYPWGGKEDKDLAQRCNMDKSGIGHTSAVGLFPSGNADCGAADMSGNVWEWCEGWYSKRQEGRVLRGGSWDYVGPVLLRCSYRLGVSPDSRDHYFGFRCVCCVGGSAPG